MGALPTRESLALKTDYMLNFNNFSTTKPILDLNVSLDMTRQDPELCLEILSQGVTL